MVGRIFKMVFMNKYHFRLHHNPILGADEAPARCGCINSLRLGLRLRPLALYSGGWCSHCLGSCGNSNNMHRSKYAT